jgi:serine/threonine-protein kinase PpkA
MNNKPEISGYKIKQRLGSGEIAAVYYGIQKKTGTRVAIKITKPSLLQETIASKRFLKEIKIISKLDHPNIVHIYETGEMNNLIYLVMEFLPESLKNRIADGTILHESTLGHLKFLNQIASALEYAHGKGIIHRDIKSENIMFRPCGTPVLLDFGLAKISGSIERLTKSDLTVGTPDTMSPEQIQGLEIDCRTDMYSLGVVFYEILTGELPYKAGNYIALAMKHLKKKVPRLPRKIKFMQPLLNQMMAKDRDKRISNATRLISLIQKYIEKGNFS